MYIHEIHYQQTLDYQEKLRKEAQNHHYVQRNSLRKIMANLLYYLAEKLEPKTTTQTETLLRS